MHSKTEWVYAASTESWLFRVDGVLRGQTFLSTDNPSYWFVYVDGYAPTHLESINKAKAWVEAMYVLGGQNG